MGQKEMKRDFVATVYIVNDNKVLLVFHKKMKMWLPPGGHIHENELPEETAIREAKEETGLDIELVGDKDPKLTDEVEPLFKPEFVQLEDINLDGHQHIDLIYLAIPKNHDIKRNDESEKIRWFSLDEMNEVPPLVIYQARRMLEKMNDIKIHKNK